MNREQRRIREKRTKGRARKAALMLLIAGSVAASTLGLQEPALAAVAGDLSVNGGGGGGGHSSGNGAGGGGYVKYMEGTNIWIDFGGGGDGFYIPADLFSPACLYGAGGIGGGGSLFFLTSSGGSSGAYPGGAAGQSGGGDPAFPTTAGEPMPAAASRTTVSGAAPYHAHRNQFPAGWAVTTDRGEDSLQVVTFMHYGNGGAGSVNVAGDVSLSSLAITGGSAGEHAGISTSVVPGSSSYNYGHGGDASFTTAGIFDVKSITLNEPTGLYDGQVTFSVGMLHAAKGYLFAAGGDPAITVGGYRFDLAGAGNGDTLLHMTGGALDVDTTSGITVALTASGALGNISPGQQITLIDNANGNFSQSGVTVSVPGGVYTFDISVSPGNSLVATLTAFVAASVSNVTISGIVGSALGGGQTTAITLTGGTVANALVNADASGWFTGLPSGITVSANAQAGSSTITLTFSGTPTAASIQPFIITIPGNLLSGGNAIPIVANPNARFNISGAPHPPSTLPKTGDGFPLGALMALLGAGLAGLACVGTRLSKRHKQRKRA